MASARNEGPGGTVEPPIGEDTLTERERARQVLQTEIDAYRNHLLERTRRWNTLAEINCLPHEILGEIFIHSTNATQRVISPDYRSRRWIKITHVCRLWREVALSTPRLWSSFYADGLDWTREMLFRSKKAPLHIRYYPSEPRLRKDRQEISTLVLRQLQRIESLTIHEDDYANFVKPPDIVSLAPLLSSLSIIGHTDRLHNLHEQPLSRVLENIAMPKLKFLDLRDSRLSWWTPLLQHTLTSLTFHRSGSSVSFDAFPGHPLDRVSDFARILKTLESMPLLEHLSLSNVLPTLRSATLPQLGLYIKFPALRSLEVTATPDSCAFLLQHLIIPHSASVAITCEDLPNDNPRNVTSAFGAKLQESSTSSLPLHTLCYDGFSIRIWNHPVDLGVLCNEYRDPPPPQFSLNASDKILSPALFVLPLDQIQSLVFREPFASGASDQHFDSAQGWLHLFARMPNVRELGAYAWFRGITEALEQRLPLPSEQPTNRRGKQKTGGIPLPNLKVLHLEWIPFRFRQKRSCRGFSVFKSLKGILQARKKSRRGLDRLVVVGCINFVAEDRDELSHFVKTVEWDGAENFDDIASSDSDDSDEDDH